MAVGEAYWAEPGHRLMDNHWYTVDHNPEAPKGSFRYGMVPNYLGPWPPLGYSQIPILGWGCRMVYRQTNDRARVERCLPYLDLFDERYSSESSYEIRGIIRCDVLSSSDGSRNESQVEQVTKKIAERRE